MMRRRAPTGPPRPRLKCQGFWRRALAKCKKSEMPWRSSDGRSSRVKRDNDLPRWPTLIELDGDVRVTRLTPKFRTSRTQVVCAKCGSQGNKIDVRPNWK